MDDALTNTQKLQKCIADGWQRISVDLKNYCDAVTRGKSHISLILSHNVTLNNVSLANVQETELLKNVPDVKEKLQWCIQEKILIEEVLVTKILKDLLQYYTNILNNIEKIERAYGRDLNLYTNTSPKGHEESISIFKGSEKCVPIVEMIEQLDAFKVLFINSHNERKYSLNLLCCMDDPEKISRLWDVSELLSLKQELDLTLHID